MDSKNSFLPVGPLTGETLYIEREADKELFRQVQQMEYVILTGPHQQGSTSMIKHLMTALSRTKWIFVYVDVSTLGTQSEKAWYTTLSGRICKDLKTILPETSLHIPQDSIEWRDFLTEIAGCACQADKELVIILDEIGGAKFENNSLFFSTLREVYTTRHVQADSELEKISFILVGSFNPRDLIRDPSISPFNIAKKIEAVDFTLDEIQELMRKRGWTKNQAFVLSEHIHHWTNGQPYLTQYLCSNLEEESSPSDVNLVVEKLLRNDTNNLSHTVKALNESPDLKIYLQRIRLGEIFPYNPNEYPWQNQLYLLGLIKADVNQNCEIRNRIYQRIIADLDLDRKGNKEQFVFQKILGVIFIYLPRTIGHAILDLILKGKDKADDTTFIVWGYISIIVAVLVLWGIVDINSLRDWFTSWWRFFHPIK